jgi:tetratricopeptide (TPR) repeat protein
MGGCPAAAAVASRLPPPRERARSPVLRVLVVQPTLPGTLFVDRRGRIGLQISGPWAFTPRNPAAPRNPRPAHPTRATPIPCPPAMPAHHLFLSYARVDDARPVNDLGQGWVAAFKAELETRHRAYSGRELSIFFDREAIDEGVDWRRRLGEGLRESRLFLAFLSPNYLTSKNCLWEWDEYLRREHSAARGDDGLTPVFFVTPADLRLREDQAIADWLAAMERKYPWFKARPDQFTAESEQLVRPFARDLGRRNHTTNLELHPWFDHGPQVLRELDAAARSLEARNTPRDPAADLRTLAARLVLLDRHIARRLDRIALADLAPGNLPRGHEHFVGRHRELSQLHDLMLTGGPQSGGRGMGGRGMIAAAFSPGGLGKTALARQYAHAYAEFYAAGGTWEIGCEGATELGAVLLRLADSPVFQHACVLRFDAATQQPVLVTDPLILNDRDREDYGRAAQAVLAYLGRLTAARAAVLLAELDRKAAAGRAERHSPDNDPPELRQPRALLILDNVDQPALLAATQIALLPAEEWLEIIVTTRLDPHRFGGGDRTFAHLEVGVLPEPDAVRLLADFQPAHRFPNPAEEEAARGIARALGGYTLAVELVAAYLGDRARDGYQPSEYLPRLAREGLVRPVDTLAGDAAVQSQIRHSTEIAQNHIATLIGWSLARLSAPARTALEFASLLMPDEIPLPWLEALTRQRHGDVLADAPGAPPRWPAVWRELRGLRLLHPAREIEVDDRGLERMPAVARIHRLVAQHVAAANADGPRNLTDLDGFLDALTTLFEQHVEQTEDSALRSQHRWLRDQLDHLIAAHPPTPTLLTSAGVAATFEGTHGSLARALDLTVRILAVQETLLAANPDSAQAAHDVSAMLERLADFLARRGQPGDADLALGHYQRSLEVRERLLATNPDSAQAARDVSVSLERLADFLARRGQPGDADLALGHYQRSLEVSERLLAANPDSAQAARDVSVSLERLADFLASRGQPGDADLALGHYQRSLEVRERLLAANPDSAQAARDVSVSLERLADFLASRGQPGDADLALGHYQRCHEVLERLLAANPDSAQASRDVSVSLERLANFLARRGQPGDADLALGHYQRSLEVSERLLAANPDSAQAARDVSVSLNKLADFLASRGQPGDADLALGHYQRSLEVRERLLAANPDSAQAARDVSVSLNKLADFLASRGQPGDADLALGHYQRCHEVLERLLAANPDSAQAARDVSVSLERLADFLARRGQPGDADLALGHYQRSLEVRERLLAANPDSAQAARDVSVSLNKLADFLASRGQPGDADLALGHYQRSLEVRERLLAANPDSAQAARDVMVSLERLAGFHGSRPGGEARGLELQTRALDIALKLREGNPRSAFYGRTAAVSFFLTYQRAQAAGQEELVRQCLAGCFAVLDELIQAGIELDPPMRDLHAQLQRLFRQG